MSVESKNQTFTKKRMIISKWKKNKIFKNKKPKRPSNTFNNSISNLLNNKVNTSILNKSLSLNSKHGNHILYNNYFKRTIFDFNSNNKILSNLNTLPIYKYNFKPLNQNCNLTKLNTNKNQVECLKELLVFNNMVVNYINNIQY